MYATPHLKQFVLKLLSNLYLCDEISTIISECHDLLLMTCRDELRMICIECMACDLSMISCSSSAAQLDIFIVKVSVFSCASVFVM